MLFADLLNLNEVSRTRTGCSDVSVLSAILHWQWQLQCISMIWLSKWRKAAGSLDTQTALHFTTCIFFNAATFGTAFPTHQVCWHIQRDCFCETFICQCTSEISQWTRTELQLKLQAAFKRRLSPMLLPLLLRNPSISIQWRNFTSFEECLIYWKTLHYSRVSKLCTSLSFPSHWVKVAMCRPCLMTLGHNLWQTQPFVWVSPAGPAAAAPCLPRWNNSRGSLIEHWWVTVIFFPNQRNHNNH